MKFTADKKMLEKSIAPVCLGVAPKNTDPLLEGIYIEAKDGTLTMCSYDREKGIRTTLEADVEREGKIVVDAQKTSAIIHSLPDGPVTIEADENLKKAIYTGSSSQQDALLGLKAGNFDAIIIDHSMASSTCGKGDYADLMILESIQLEDEYYAIGFRVGSDMIEKVNGIIDELIADGTLAAIAAKYNKTEVYEAAIADNK